MVNAQDVLNATNRMIPYVLDVFSGAQEGYDPVDFYRAHKRVDESGKIRRVDSNSSRSNLALILSAGKTNELFGSMRDIEAVKKSFERRGKEQVEAYALANVNNLLGELGVGDEANPKPGNDAMMRFIFRGIKPESFGALIQAGDEEKVKPYNDMVGAVAQANLSIETIRRDPRAYSLHKVGAFNDEGVQRWYLGDEKLLDSLAKNGENSARETAERGVNEYGSQKFITETLGRLAPIRANLAESHKALDSMAEGPERYALSEQLEGARAVENVLGGMLKGLIGDAVDKIDYKMKVAQAQAAAKADKKPSGKPKSGKGKKK